MRRASDITSATRLCAVIGSPVSHSLSPVIHNAAFDELGLDFVYLAFAVQDLESALAGLRALANFRGMSLTIPHKVEALRFVDEVAEVDRRIGSINTVINEGGRLKGFGTDGPGALKALVDAGVGLDGREVLMLGAGGSARAIAFTLALTTRLKKLTILNPGLARVQALTDDLKRGTPARIEAGALDADSLARSMGDDTIVINCTPVGMHPQVGVSVVPAALLRPGQAVFDIIYTPLETQLLADARSRGLQVVSGVEMFINQAVLQFRAFTGREPPVDTMRRVVMKKLIG